MSLTSRFGLHVLDDQSTAQDRDAFARLDPAVVDHLLAAFESHNHTGGARLLDPGAPPTAAVNATGGTLPSGATFGYCVSYVDANGLETAASEIVTAATPASVAPPAAPTLAAQTSGTLAAGLYHYALSSKAGGDITPLGPVALISLDPTEHTVSVITPDVVPDGVDNFVVWRMGPLDSAWTQLGETPGQSAVAFIDDGSIPSQSCPCDPGTQPPVGNVTRATASIEISLGEQLPAGVVRWRVYRSETDGSFSGDNLAAEIQPGDDGTLPTGWLDTGDAMLAGAPSPISRTLTPTVVIPTLVVTALPDIAGLQDGTLAILRDVNGVNLPELHAIVNRAWSLLSGGTTPTPQPASTHATSVTLTSPGGTLYDLVVADDGTLSTVRNVHDTVARALALPHTASGTIQLDSTGYGQDPDAVTAGNTRSHMAWFKFTPAADAVVHFDTTGSGVDCALFTFTMAPGGTTYADLTLLNIDTTSPNAAVDSAVTAGTDVYVLVADTGPAGPGSATLTLNWTGMP